MRHLAEQLALADNKTAQAQVRDARAALSGQQDVGALDVQVRDTVAVQEAQAARNVQRHPVAPARRQPGRPVQATTYMAKYHRQIEPYQVPAASALKQTTKHR